MNLSIAKCWRISLNGREDSLALFRRRWGTQAAIFLVFPAITGLPQGRGA
jgi:hypothetical protein